MITDRRATASHQFSPSHAAKPLPRRRLGDLDDASFDRFMQHLLADVERQRLEAVLATLGTKGRQHAASALA